MARTHVALPADVVAEIKVCLREADQLLAIDHATMSPDDIQERIFNHIINARESGMDVPEEQADALGCLWADAICREMKWEWAWLKFDGEEAPGILSPTRSLAALPIPYIAGLLSNPESDPTSVLVYNMLKEGGFTDKPGAYSLIG